MKKFIFIALVFFGLLGCERFRPNPPTDYYETFSLDTPAEIKLGQCLRDYSAKINICFHAVITDTRCSGGVDCTEGGEAIVRLSFHTNKNEDVVLTLKNGESQTTSSGYSIKFTELLPHPDSPNAITSRDYKVMVIVSKSE